MTEQNISSKFWEGPRGTPGRERITAFYYFVRERGQLGRLEVRGCCFLQLLSVARLPALLLQLPMLPSPNASLRPPRYRQETLQDPCLCLPVPPIRPFCSAWRSSCGYVGGGWIRPIILLIKHFGWREGGRDERKADRERIEMFQ